MSVEITSLEDFGSLDDLGSWWKTTLRVASGVATGGASELAWNKKARNTIASGVKTIGKNAAKVAVPALCVASKVTKDLKASGGYAQAAVMASGVINKLCGGDKKKEEKPPWWQSPMIVGGIAVGAGLLLGAIAARD